VRAVKTVSREDLARHLRDDDDSRVAGEGQLQ